MKHKLVVLIIFSALFFLMATPARAELVVFRLEPINPQLTGPAKICAEFSLNENFSQTTRGRIGPNCDFEVDLGARGEWETTGKYFDTPPYAWGYDRFYDVEISLDERYTFSFTCEQPIYQLDESSLPSYVTKTGEEDLPSTGGSQPSARGKRFKFHISESAPTSGSFNLTFGFSTNCVMKQRWYDSLAGGWKTAVLEAVNPETNPGSDVPIYSGCGDLPVRNINPRTADFSLPFVITEICLPPTSTPRPTATPRPTVTPLPTATPTRMPTSSPTPRATATPTRRLTATPTGWPTATPTPEAPATCACWLLTAEGNPDLSRVNKGQLLSFIAEAFTSTPETAKVIDMVFVLEHEGREVANSGTIPAYLNRSEVIGGVNTDVYRSTWSWRVPTSGDVEGLYHLKLIIHCGWKEGKIQKYFTSQSFRVLGESVTPTQLKPGFSFGSLLEKILNFLGLGKQEAARIQAEATPTPKIPFQPPFPTEVRPMGEKSLQVGTFFPVPTLPARGCTDLYFQIPKNYR